MGDMKRGVLKPREGWISCGNAFVGTAVFAYYFPTADFTVVSCGAVVLFHALHGFAAARKSKSLTLACSNGTTGFQGNVTTVAIVLNPPVFLFVF